MLNTSLKSTDDISWRMDSVKQSPVKIGLVFLTNMINQWLPIKRNVKTPIAKNLEILSACACNEGSCARKKFFLFATQRFRNVPFRKWMSSFSDGLELCLTLLCHLSCNNCFNADFPMDESIPGSLKNIKYTSWYLTKMAEIRVKKKS